jgi:hypothetical protein
VIRVATSITACRSLLGTLLRFFVRLVASAIIAELLELKPIRCLLLVLGRNIVTMFTLGALKSDIISWHNSSTAKLKVYQLRRESASSQKLKASEAALAATSEMNRAGKNYSIMSETVPAPTVLPPSLIANLSPFSIAIGAINSTSNDELSPGITISTPSFNVATPVTSVVRK